MSEESKLRIIHKAKVTDDSELINAECMNLQTLLDAMENLDAIIEHHLTH